MKIETEIGEELEIPAEIEKLYLKELEEGEEIELDEFLEYLIDYYDGKLVSEEVADFWVEYHACFIDPEGGYPHVIEMVVKGVKFQAVWWGEDKYPSIHTYASEVEEE